MESRGRSWMGVGCSVWMAARFLNGREFHKLDASAIGVVHVERPFSIAPDFRPVKFRQPALAKFVRGRVNVRNAERKMVLHAELLVIRVSGNVEHIFYPVVTVR